MFETSASEFMPSEPSHSEGHGLVGHQVGVGNGYYQFEQKDLPTPGVMNFAQEKLNFVLFDKLGVHTFGHGTYKSAAPLNLYIDMQSLAPAFEVGMAHGNIALQPLTNDPSQTSP